MKNSSTTADIVPLKLSDKKIGVLSDLLEAELGSSEPIDYYKYIHTQKHIREDLDYLEKLRLVQRNFEECTIRNSYHGLLKIGSYNSRKLCEDCDLIFMQLRKFIVDSNNSIRISANYLTEYTHLEESRIIQCATYLKCVIGIMTEHDKNNGLKFIAKKPILQYESFSDFALHRTPIHELVHDCLTIEWLIGNSKDSKKYMAV